MTTDYLLFICSKRVNLTDLPLKMYRNAVSKKKQSICVCVKHFSQLNFRNFYRKIIKLFLFRFSGLKNNKFIYSFRFNICTVYSPIQQPNGTLNNVQIYPPYIEGLYTRKNGVEETRLLAKMNSVKKRKCMYSAFPIHLNVVGRRKNLSFNFS